MEHLLRTGNLPGFFDSDTPPGGLRVKKDSAVIVNRKRAPRLKGYGMPGTGAKPQPGESPRMPRKRRKRFDGSW